MPGHGEHLLSSLSSFNIHKTRPLCVLHKLSTAHTSSIPVSQALKQAPLCLPGPPLSTGLPKGTRLALQFLSASPGARHPCLSNSEGWLPGSARGAATRTLPEHLSRALLPPFCHLLALPSPTKCEPDKTKAQKLEAAQGHRSHHCNGSLFADRAGQGGPRPRWARVTVPPDIGPAFPS